MPPAPTTTVGKTARVGVSDRSAPAGMLELMKAGRVSAKFDLAGTGDEVRMG
jgi:hypothetical protein